VLRRVVGVLATAAALLGGSWLGAAETPATEVRVRVTETGTGEALPCRLTLVDEQGQLAPFTAPKEPWLAYRTGVLYTGTGNASFSLPRGRYTLYATRGTEYGLVTRRIEVGSRPIHLDMALAREVDTQGYVACDTHIHTLEFSGHGDASAAERMATLAGEGIELPIATEHNRHVDYSPIAEATGTRQHFTPVTGNEVTTSNGHFNVFPVRAGARPPEFRLTDWAALFAGIRATPGVRIVIQNHPSGNHDNYIPTDPKRFHPLSGESYEGREWAVDGMEVINSGALQSDGMRPYRDWFAQLNRGRKIAGVGSSDSHDVNRFIVGQGRTYIASSAERPDRIDVEEACANFLAGKVLASEGLFTEAWVDGRAGVGDLATGGGRELKVRVRVQGPRWITADRVELFADGEKVFSRPLLPDRSRVVRTDLIVTLPRPKHDVWLVAIASGPGVREPYWPIARPYQPSRGDWEPRVVGSTNPIRVDGDGDRGYTSPLEYARRLIEAGRHGTPGAEPPANLMEALAGYDSAVAVQAASLLRGRGVNLSAGPYARAVEAAVPQVRQAVVAYRSLLPP
jgi:hypothetical protein